MTNSNSVSVNLKEYIEQISYKKALTYTKAEVDALIRNGLSDVELVEIVNTLPTGTNIKNNKIYLLNNGKSQTENRFDVYVHTPNNGWEKVDAIDFDITDYYNETQVDNLLAQKAPNNHASTATTYGVSDASKYGHSMASSTSPKMDGTAAVGSETGKFARGDHVHPTDTSRAPNNHASTATTYGVSDASKYGHSMASSTSPKMDGTAAVGSETGKFARGDHVHPTDTSRAASSHTHGNITNDGKIGSTTGEIVVTNSGSLTTGNPTTAKIKEASALSNIASEANATQHDVNDKINTTLGNKVDKVSGKGLSTNDFTGTYKTKLDNLETTIANSISNLDLVEIVTTLPTTNIKDNKLYLKANSASKNDNKYDIYMYVNNAWEKVDAIDFDIADYYNETEVNNLLAEKAPNNHASADTTYGAANTVKYGHAMATSTTPKMDGTATMGSETSKFARGDHIHPTDTSRASSTHTHGNITNDGKIGTSTGEIVVTNSGSLTTGNPTTAKIKEASALSNIASEANATQHDVNDKINTALGNKVDPEDLSRVAFSGSYLDLSDKPSSHESVYTNMGDVLSSYYIFSKYTEDGDLCLGKLEDIGDIELSVATNAVVTDDEVTYSATVTDIDGDLVPGVYVEFFEDEEIIGTGITNQNGVASYTKVYTESTICDVKAKIGTEEGDITMFVKDKNNLLTFNQWTCTDYLKNTEGFSNSPACGIESSTEYAVNGERSLKITKLDDRNSYTRITYNKPLIEKTITFSGTINTKGNMNITIFEMYNNVDINVSRINIPSGVTQEFAVSLTTSAQNDYFIFQALITDDTYWDNLQLNIQ